MMKSLIQKFSFIVVLATTLVTPLFAAKDYHVEDQPQVIERAMEIEQIGTLKQKPNGYVYLEVNRDFIGKTLPLVEAPGKITPPQHYTSKKGIGAHISVMEENELIMNEIWEIQELGQQFPFTVHELRTVKINKNGKAKKLWLIAVTAPELELLRMNYGLSSLLKGHDFHITLGSQNPGALILMIEEPLDQSEELVEAA
jgi:hypothetical protein